ncbi:unnamed protein product [Dovyalis caffra]|uniref:Uncharacterized protein n=1 Tax=Dovyalis caffra TaxID=77055 RepID=A0AAV1QP45_9ROSI|nr:unnamed protein product [Dovyalis caffra]
MSDGNNEATGTVTTVVAVVVIGLLIYSCCRCRTKTNEGKTMKAPGQDFRIPREEFVENPSGYFRNLRKKNGWRSGPNRNLVVVIKHGLNTVVKMVGHND